MPKLQFNISQLSPLFVYLKKQQEIEKNRRIFELAITFVLISFFLFFAVRPTILTISSLVGEIKSKEILSSKMKSKIDQIITAQDNFSLAQEKYYLVEDALPQNPNYVNAFNQIDTITQQNSINTNKMIFIQSEKNYFTTKISTSSAFLSHLNFIDSLFHGRRLINVSQIVFSQNKETQAKGQVNISIPIDIYYWDNNKYEKK